MRFLALAPWQALLLAVLTTAIVVALYFLKRRHRKVTVSSVLLWNRLLDENQPQSLIEKLRWLISMLIAVTIALLIALSAGRPEVEAITGKSRRIAVVIDTSPTMATRTSDGKTRLEHAVEQARTILYSGKAGDEFLVADTSGRIVTSPTSNRKQSLQALEFLSLVAGAPRFPKIDLEEAEQIYFISDGVVIRDFPRSAERVSVFEPADNVGITAFEIRSIPSNPLGYEAYLEVVNYSRQTKEVQIVLGGTTRQRINRKVRLAAGESLEELVDVSRLGGGGIRATVQATGDALEADNVAFAYLPVRARARAMLVTDGNSYLETLLRMVPSVDLTVLKPSQFREGTAADLYVFDRYAPPRPPSKPALLFRPPNVGWVRGGVGLVRRPQAISWNDAHPTMQFVPVHDLMIEEAVRIEPGETQVILASRQTPLIVASEKPVKWVQLTFNLNDSDLPFHLAFPIFMENVLAWFGGEQLAIRRSPGIVKVPLSNAQIRTIDGQPVPSRPQLGNTVFEATKAGLFTVRQGDTRLHVAVNVANRALSDVNSSLFENDRARATFERPWLQRELWFYMLLAAVAMIGGEWLTYHRRITL